MKKNQRGINPASKPSGNGGMERLVSPEGWWSHLRWCAECGHIGCCDSSQPARIQACRGDAVVPTCAAKFVMPAPRRARFLPTVKWRASRCWTMDSIPPPGRGAQDGSRSHLRQQLTQPASRFQSGCRQLRKLPASSSRAFAAAGQEAIFAVRLAKSDPDPAP